MSWQQARSLPHACSPGLAQFFWGNANRQPFWGNANRQPVGWKKYVELSAGFIPGAEVQRLHCSPFAFYECTREWNEVVLVHLDKHMPH